MAVQTNLYNDIDSSHHQINERQTSINYIRGDIRAWGKRAPHMDIPTGRRVN